MSLRDLFLPGNESGKSREKNLERIGVILLLLYLLAGMIYSAVLPAVARFPDEDEYLKLSYNLVHGPGYSMDGVNLTACRPPGYAFFLAGIRVLGGGFFSFRAAQFLLLGATVVLLSRLSSEKKPFAGLLVVTCLVICYPLLFYTSATLYPQILAGFLFVLALVLTLIEKRGLALNLVTGLTFGALIFEVPTFLFTMVIGVGAAGLLKIIRWRDVLVIVLAASLVVGAWTARNAALFHRFVPIASNSGLSLLMGNNSTVIAYEAASNVGMNPYYARARSLGLDEFQSDRFYRDQAVSWIQAHPGHALVLYFEKVLNFFNIINVYQTRQEVTAWKQAVMAVAYLLLLGLLAWRLAEIRRFPLVPREKLFLIVYILSAFTAAIFFTRIRYRLPYDYLIMAIIAQHLSRRLEIWMTSRRSSKAPGRSGAEEATNRA